MNPRLLICLAAVVPALATTLRSADEAPAKPITAWVQADGSPPAAGWEIKDGVIHRAAKAGDIYTSKEYGDFTLEWDWKIAVGGNSGVKYRVMKYGDSLLGPEYQMIDDEKHADGTLPSHRTAAIYDLFPTIDNKPIKAVGEWNESRVTVRGTKFEHWLNGTKVAECDTATPAWEAALAKSKFKSHAQWAKNAKGRIMLQDHGDEVWFRNVRIREL
jgi:hypothetical protein